MPACYRFNKPLFLGVYYDSTLKRDHGSYSDILQLLPDSAPAQNQRYQRSGRMAIRKPALRDEAWSIEEHALYSFWEPVGRDSIHIHDATQMHSQNFRLAMRNDSLVGTTFFSSDIFEGHVEKRGKTMVMIWDPPRLDQVSAVRIACPKEIASIDPRH